jgi:hypothetical protein
MTIHDTRAAWQRPGVPPQGGTALRRERHWDDLASRTRLAGSGEELRALHGESRLDRYVTGPAEVPLGQLEILERGVR